MKYAHGTTVTSDRSVSEIERLMKRYGADTFARAWERNSATILFEMKGRRVRIRVPMPTFDDEKIKRSEAGKKRTESQQRSALEQETKRRWRALVLVIKAKLEAVASEVSTFDQEFLPFFVLPGGDTVSERLRPELEGFLSGRDLPPLLTG